MRSVQYRKQRVVAPKGENAGLSIAFSGPGLQFRPYQREAFENRTNGIEVWLWARQTGKSFTAAAWAVDRLVTRPGRLVTILSNSKMNGMEVNRRCAEVCQTLGRAFEQVDLAGDHRFESFNTETRIAIDGKVGRIKALAANARTARGFSGDLILDEFAFQEDGAAIWEAAEPILASNADFLCRIVSSPNGKHNMHYRLATDRNIPVRRVTRTEAYQQGCPVFHPITRQAITPAEARALASNKRAYDQNYECVFEDENMALLTYELIAAAEREDVGIICEENWSEEALRCLQGEGRGAGPLFAGVDVGRRRNLTVITVVEKSGASYLVRAMLRLADMRLPEQQRRLEMLLANRRVQCVKFDMTGLGLGLFEYTREKFGSRVHGLDFATCVPAGAATAMAGDRRHSVRAPEHLATKLLQVYEDRAIQHPADAALRDDLRKPEKLVGPGGRVSIAATSDQAGHADHFWSLALAIDAAQSEGRMGPTYVKVIPRWKRPLFNTGRHGITF